MPQVIVLKCGGNAMVDLAALCRDVADLRRDGVLVVIVHGGASDIDRLAARLGVRSRRMVAPDGISTRYTDTGTLEVVQLALTGLAKPRIVRALTAEGVSAVGLTGVDGGLIQAERKRVHRALVDGRLIVVRDDHSGRITDVDARLLNVLLADGRTPVISPPVLADDGCAVNADADRVAAAIAVALRATTLVLLTAAPGVLADPADEASALDVCPVARSGPPPLVGGGIGMKLVAAREALLGGVSQVVIADGRRPRPVHAALGKTGTIVVLDPAGAGAVGGERR